MADVCELNDSNDTENGGRDSWQLLLEACAVKQVTVIWN